MKRYGLLAQLVVGVTAFGLTMFVVALVFYVRQGDTGQSARAASTQSPRSGNVEFAIAEGTIGSGSVSQKPADTGEAGSGDGQVAAVDAPPGDFDPSRELPGDDTPGPLAPELAAVVGGDSAEELLAPVAPEAAPVTEKLPEITGLR